MGILQKSLLLEAIEIVTCHWGGWVSKEDVTIYGLLAEFWGLVVWMTTVTRKSKTTRKKYTKIYNNSNLLSIVSSTLILTACLASETVTWWRVFTTLYLKHFHCIQNILSETWTCLNSGHSALTRLSWLLVKVTSCWKICHRFK